MDSKNLEKNWVLTESAFAELLKNLHVDVNQAPAVYENIRSRIIRFFRVSGSAMPEDHTDEVFNQVARRISEGERLDAENPKFSNPADANRFTITEFRGNEFGSFPSGGKIYEPAIPALLSTVIIIGQITDSKAFLTEDRTGIYSEFYVKPIQILKNDSSGPFKTGDEITIWRWGGAVKFASGKRFQRLFGGKPMPHIKGKYVFFLKYDAETEDYPLITAYEIKDGRITSLDGIEVNWTPVYELLSHQTYNGLSETEFIDLVQRAIELKQDLFDRKKQ